MRKDFQNHLMNWLIFLISVYFKSKSKNSSQSLKFTRIMLVFCNQSMILEKNKTIHLRTKCFNFHFKTLNEIATLLFQEDKGHPNKWLLDSQSLVTLMMMVIKVPVKRLNKTLSTKNFLRQAGSVELSTTWKRNRCLEVLLKPISQVTQKIERMEDSFSRRKNLKCLQTRSLKDLFNKKLIDFSTNLDKRNRQRRNLWIQVSLPQGSND